MKEDIKNPPAFPIYAFETDRYLEVRNDGMTLKDWFAGQALTGMALFADEVQKTVEGELIPSKLATAAYEIATAMLKARSE